MTPDKAYYSSLLHTICVDRGSDTTFYLLCRSLYSIPFSPFVPNDQNRESDIFEMREEFSKSIGGDQNALEDKPATMLELFVLLSVDMGKEVDTRVLDKNAGDWFLELLTNCGLIECDDKNFDSDGFDKVLEVCERINSRNYEYDGFGGLFPLVYPPSDCRHVELAYQMKQYMYEKYYTMGPENG